MKEESHPSSHPQPNPLLELPLLQQKSNNRIIIQLPPNPFESQQEPPQCVAAKSLMLVPPKLFYTLRICTIAWLVSYYFINLFLLHKNNS